jgi:anthranilate synthase/aminodeoxychorismate synthase-like glutamine amidotransferase
MILMIDNYDSFTYNLVHLFQEAGEEVQVRRNDRITLSSVRDLGASAIVISPGPGSPCEAGVSVEVIRRFGPEIPILGVCLGHQSIAAAFGGRVLRAGRVVHGKTSRIFHDGRSIYRGVPNPFEAVRYHSLIVEKESLPGCLEVSAWTTDGEIMGLRHRGFKTEGVQFHPESIFTVQGQRIVRNFIRMKKRKKGGKGNHDQGSDREDSQRK